MSKKMLKVSRRKKAAQLVTQPDVPVRDVSFPQGGQVLRFIATSALLQVPVTRKNLLCAILRCNATTTYNRLIQSVRVNKIEMWSNPLNTAGTTDLGMAISWGTTAFDSDRVRSDIHIGFDEPAYVSSRPPKDSTASFWSYVGQNETESLFYLTGPPQTIIDLHVQVTMSSGDNVALPNVTLSTSGITGAMYFCCLDGPTGSGLVSPINPLLATH